MLLLSAAGHANAQAIVDPVSISPSSGSGAPQAFTLQYTDSLGANDLLSARVRIGASNVAPGTCSAWYDATAGTIKLMNDAGLWGAPVPLGGGALTNSQCTIDLASSTAAPSGTTLTLVLQISFASGFTGLKNVYMLAGSATGPTSGWIQRGTWTTGGNACGGPHEPVSITPDAGSGVQRVFTVQYCGDLTRVRVRFAASNVAPGTCSIMYTVGLGAVQLMDDAGGWGIGVTIPGAGWLSNSQCTLRRAGTPMATDTKCRIAMDTPRTDVSEEAKRGDTHEWNEPVQSRSSTLNTAAES